MLARPPMAWMATAGLLVWASSRP